MDNAEESYLSTIVSYLFIIGVTIAHVIIMMQTFLYRDKQHQLWTIFANVDSLFRHKLRHKND